MPGTEDRDFSGTLDKQKAGAGTWKAPVATLAALPATDTDGAVRLVIDTDIMYTYDALLPGWKQITTGGTPGDMTKAIYDTNNDGVVNNADGLKPNAGAETLSWNAVDQQFVSTKGLKAATKSDFDGDVVASANLQMDGGAGKWFQPPKMTTSARNTMVGAWGVTEAGRMWFNTDTSQWEGWDGTQIVIVG